MKCVRIDQYGGPDVLHVVDAPAPANPRPDEVLVRIRAAGMNPADLLQVAGRYFTRPSLPWVPGGEAAGVVEAVGPAVRTFRPGDRVMVRAHRPGGEGTWREALLAPAEHLLPTPGALSDEQAGSAQVVYLTAWLGLVEYGGLQPGEWLLVTGANSAVALAALQVARSVGAQVLGVVRSDAAERVVAEAGYDGLIRLDRGGLREQAEALSGGGVHLVFDCLAGDVATECLAALRSHGRFVGYGALSGAPIAVRGGLLVGKQPTIRGLWLTRWLHDASPERIQALYDHLLPLFADRTLVPAVDRAFPLEQVQQAAAYLQTSGRAGKVVLVNEAEAPARA